MEVKAGTPCDGGAPLITAQREALQRTLAQRALLAPESSLRASEIVWLVSYERSAKIASLESSLLAGKIVSLGTLPRESCPVAAGRQP